MIDYSFDSNLEALGRVCANIFAMTVAIWLAAHLLAMGF